jgi:hypothetical protein
MKTLKFLVFAMLTLSMSVACSSDKLSENDMLEQQTEEEIQVVSKTPSSEQKNRLDYIFSAENELLRDQYPSSMDDLLFVINNRDDIIKLQGFSEDPDIWLEFDWDNYSIIGCKIYTHSVSDKILSGKLVAYPDTSSYGYEIEVKNCTECYWGIGKFYLWEVYPRKLNPEDVSLVIKIIK